MPSILDIYRGVLVLNQTYCGKSYVNKLESIRHLRKNYLLTAK